MVKLRALIDFAVEHGGDLADLVDQFGELGGENGLHAVGEGLVWSMMDFDEQAVGANGCGGARERQNFVAFARAVTGIDQDGQMAAFFYGGNWEGGGGGAGVGGARGSGHLHNHVQWSRC